MNKVQTTKIQGGADYAKVSDRLKAFRSDNPRASIETTPIPLETGLVMFKAKILKDKSDEFSADATGHAMQTKSGTKDFEKLETIAVGRALALLGYGADGEIASSEEMEEFQKFQENKKQELVEAGEKALRKAKNIDELADVWLSLGGELQQELLSVKNEMKKSYENN